MFRRPVHDRLYLTTLRVAYRGGVVAMALLAAAKLTDELLRLVWRSDVTAALDLRDRYREVQAWFAGVPVYQSLPGPTYPPVTYPPATYVAIWPLLGWMPYEVARGLWAVTSLAALAWLAWLMLRETGVTGTWHRAAVVLLLLAMNQTGVAIGNGQFILHLLPPLVAGILLVHRGRGSWAEDLIAAACAVFAMVKVTLAAPFLWLVLFAPATLGTANRIWPWRVRPAMLTAAAYLALTFFAVSFQDGSVADQLRGWMRVANAVSDEGGDYANLNSWLDGAGYASLVPTVSLVAFISLGLWLHRSRDADLWVRLGVIAIVTRFLAYHRVYDDVLVVLGFVALCRIAMDTARESDSGAVALPIAAIHAAHQRVAVTLIATSMVFMLLPARLGTAPAPWQQIFNLSHTTTWLAMLGFLVWYASRLPPPARTLQVTPAAARNAVPPRPSGTAWPRSG